MHGLMSNSLDIRAGEAGDLDIASGTAVILEPEGLGRKVRTHFVGMERDCYVILSLTPLLEQGNALARVLTRGTRVKVFYTSGGSVHAFLSKVLASTTKPYLHLFLSYPGDLEACNLRSGERTECHLPAVADLFGGTLEGMVVDISEGGCGLSLPLEGGQGMESFKAGDRLSLRFHINLASREYRAGCRVMNVRDCGDKTFLGLQFTEIEDSAVQSVREFINYVLFHRI